jgi:ABC-type glycerol-3-phosphate transport system substrate-binding protein
MKKIILFAVMALGLFACSNQEIDVDDPKAYCWKVTISASLMGQTASQDAYVWCTGAELQEIIDYMDDDFEEITDLGGNYNVNTKKTSIANEQSCMNNNKQY